MFKVIKKKPVEIIIPPEPYPYRDIDADIATFDTETDPFDFDTEVKPFTCGFYVPCENLYVDFWGKDCIDQFFYWLASYTEKRERKLIVNVHNGGNFDFYFLLDYLDSDQKPFIINGRLVRLNFQGVEFRDSYSMIPVALAKYDKDQIDYWLFYDWAVSDIKTKRKTTVRQLYKDEIRKYQKRDCTSLSELVVPWYERYGNKLTMASAALALLRSYHGFETMTRQIDALIRPYYFGGRCQAFKWGVLKAKWKIYDINSSYPNVMDKYEHPVTATPKYEKKITERTMFARIRATSKGALPVRTKTGLSFPHTTGDFFACIHEIKAAQKYGLLKIHEVYETIYFDKCTTFSKFIQEKWGQRLTAKELQDAVNDLLYKLEPNSSYGKFAQDPSGYESYLFDPTETPKVMYCEPCHSRIMNNEPKCQCDTCEIGVTSPFGYYLHTVQNGRLIYAKPQQIIGNRGFFNVATAASITSAARAELLHGIAKAKNPIYCDTDSIICESLEVNHNPKELGAWKLEGEGDLACIAGKKLYAIFSNGVCVKQASKGVRLKPEQIRSVCEGNVIEYKNPVPKFKFDDKGNYKSVFTTRNVRMTGND